ncbi:MAG: GNAT family N-acetyltransferase [Halobacteriota archaeon]
MEGKVKIREMKKADIPQVADVLAKAYATNPVFLAIYQGKPMVARRLQITFAAEFKYGSGNFFIAELDGRILGGMWIAEWPACQATSLKMILPGVRAAGGLAPLIRITKMLGAWKKHDPQKPHWHLKIVGIEPDFQSKGIGSQMMELYCDIVDRNKLEGYLETDRPENVPFYERFGFKVVEEEIEIGVKYWLMLRPAKVVK